MKAKETREVIRLFPTPSTRVSLHGLYLAHDLRSQTRNDQVFCFSNFVVSLDGRVSVSDSPDEPPSGVPPSLTSPEDWRLFQELVAQADAVLVSGRYVHDVGTGRAQPLVQLDRPGMADLGDWRRDAGLSPAPSVVVVSSSLDFEPEAALRLGSRVLVVTDDDAPRERSAALTASGIAVVSAGTRGVEGSRLADALAESGHHTIFATAGPVILHLLVAAGLLDRLFITSVGRLLGGHHFSTLSEGELFVPPAGFQLEALYLDPESHRPESQLFALYTTNT
ncbi:MAG: dihydrofolate reductase family protein [Acidimicrobiia bacterium]|nr:dihydrofolate reductase family protein [Acidimicrobiia bacterium]